MVLVEPMLAQAAESIPPAHVLAAGVAYEQKFDGHRALLFTPTTAGGRVLLQTRRGALAQDRSPAPVTGSRFGIGQTLFDTGRRARGDVVGLNPSPLVVRLADDAGFQWIARAVDCAPARP
ncbi:hypothetical protein ACGFXC_36100 [Streptomyces sp. NPDC048507]|uniref:hypothetical protein n=1 Tax=Streptomyces sp. NPDC048507 TaxID=3365560 RepID=UPI003723E552